MRKNVQISFSLFMDLQQFLISVILQEEGPGRDLYDYKRSDYDQTQYEKVQTGAGAAGADQ